MDSLFAPESVAIAGLSSKPGNIPRITLENILRWGYRGRIFGINARSEDDQVEGVRMYQKVEDLPEVPDLVYCLLPARFIPDMVESCGRAGVKWMAIPAGGFSELNGEGRALADDTLERARTSGVRLVGPNGLTVADTTSGLCLPFVPLNRPPAGKMSIVAQSGGVSLMMFNYLVDENIGLAKFASIGNKLDTDETDFLEYLGDDPETRIICMYLESIERGERLVEVASKIDKPIIVYKANTTSAGSRAAMSHTAALTNDDDIIDCAFEKAGITRIHNYHDFFAAAKAHLLPPMKGKRIMVMSPAGGFSVMTADLCEKAGFEFADPGGEFYSKLAKFTNAGVIKFSNPLDMGDIYDADAAARVIYSVMHSDAIDGAVFVSQRPRMPEGDTVFHRMFLTDISKETRGAMLSAGKPMGVCLFGPRSLIARAKRVVSFPIFNSPEELVRAMAMNMNFNTNHKRREPDLVDTSAAEKLVNGMSGFRGEETLNIIGALGISVPVSLTAATAEAAVAIARKIGFPVVMKLVSPDALHKSDVGGVVTGVRSVTGVRKAFSLIRSNLEGSIPGARFTGVRIQEMAPGGIDMFVGGKFDRSFGPVVFFGLGGIHVEVFRDIASLMCPAGRDEILEKLRGLRSYKLLEGVRGANRSDISAFADIVMRVSHLMHACPGIKELDINPVRVLVKGAIALDCRMRIEGRRSICGAR